jgi:hypothetical protein
LVKNAALRTLPGSLAGEAVQLSWFAEQVDQDLHRLVSAVMAVRRSAAPIIGAAP